MVDARLAALLLLSGPLIAADGGLQPVTFARDVAPILQARCEECHRPGTAAPMSLAGTEIVVTASNRSSAVIPGSRCIEARKLLKARCGSWTPLGTPVEPLV